MVSPHTTLPDHPRLVVFRRRLKVMPRNLGGGPSHTSQTLAYSCVALSGTLALPLGPRAAFPVPVRSEEMDPGKGEGWSLVGDTGLEAESHQLQPRTGAEEMTAPVARKAG